MLRDKNYFAWIHEAYIIFLSTLIIKRGSILQSRYAHIFVAEQSDDEECNFVADLQGLANEDSDDSDDENTEEMIEEEEEVDQVESTEKKSKFDVFCETWNLDYTLR